VASKLGEIVEALPAAVARIGGSNPGTPRSSRPVRGPGSEVLPMGPCGPGIWVAVVSRWAHEVPRPNAGPSTLKTPVRR